MTDCSICLLDIDIVDSTHTQNCNHNFHVNCLNQWFKVNNSCPLCRTVQTLAITDTPIDITNIIIYNYNNIYNNYIIYRDA
jgi:hypothetical protein